MEHPAQSDLWGKASKRRKSYSTRLQGVPDLPLPGEPPDKYGGYTIEVNQVDWGHAALKPTWLYIVGVPRAKLPRMPTPRAPTHVIVNPSVLVVLLDVTPHSLEGFGAVVSGRRNVATLAAAVLHVGRVTVNPLAWPWALGVGRDARG